MSADPHLSALASLNAKERQILAMLTAGHTVKTIAVQLGRSEASINERLRDARRKTGMGSSRELARLIDEQENRDKKADLFRPAVECEPLGRLHKVEGRSSKGITVMLFAMPFVAAGLALATPALLHTSTSPGPVSADASQQSQLVGTWSLDVMQIPAAERPRSVTIAFRIGPDGKWTTEVEIAEANGTVQRAVSTAATDGVAVPVNGDMGFIDTVALRQPAAGTLVMTLGKDGAPVSTRVYTVQHDRNAMTETIVWTNTRLPELETTYFHRIG